MDPTQTTRTDRVVWTPNQLEFSMTTYLTDKMPPEHLTSSARCIVVKGREVLLIADRDGLFHVTPGGQIEHGETPEVAVRRELLEETSLEVSNLHYIGFLHYLHQLPKPDNFSYLYPDFYQVVYAAEVNAEQLPIAEDSWVVEANFMDITDAQKMISKSEQLLLERAAHTIYPNS